jgi:hypothetical protein
VQEILRFTVVVAGDQLKDTVEQNECVQDGADDRDSSHLHLVTTFLLLGGRGIV